MSKFNHAFRIESARLKDWDYSSPWWYYVTINTKNHIEHFGKVEKELVVLNQLGLIVNNEWEKTKSLRINVELDNYVIMPTHLHGIIILNRVETCRGMSLENKTQLINETRFSESLQQTNSEFGKPIKNSLSIIINHFKGSVKRWANKNGYTNFAWQPRFYDRIIHNEKELYNIRKYMEQNPLKWELEKDNPENLFEM
jgi:REP element-mobilizing transposase RayT